MVSLIFYSPFTAENFYHPILRIVYKRRKEKKGYCHCLFCFLDIIGIRVSQRQKYGTEWNVSHNFLQGDRNVIKNHKKVQKFKEQVSMYLFYNICPTVMYYNYTSYQLLSPTNS